MKLSIITLTYNNLDYTKKYIESLYKYTKDFELIIVDNGSTDGTVEYLKGVKEVNGIKLILNKENQGYSKGNNQGLEIAEGEYIGFLNNDILLSKNWFEEIEKVFQKENAGFVSPLQIESKFADLIKYKYNEPPYKKSFGECSFACVITKKEVLDKIGGFDIEYTPAFFEDDDLKYRAIQNGYGVFVCNSSRFFHYGSITSKDLNFNFIKNRNYYYSKHQFGEYLSANDNEIYELKTIIQQFSKFPLREFYYIYILCRKIKNRILGIIKK